MGENILQSTQLIEIYIQDLKELKKIKQSFQDMGKVQEQAIFKEDYKWPTDTNKQYH